MCVCVLAHQKIVTKVIEITIVKFFDHERRERMKEEKRFSIVTFSIPIRSFGIDVEHRRETLVLKREVWSFFVRSSKIMRIKLVLFLQENQQILPCLAVEETTSALRVAGTAKVAGYSSSANHLTAAANAPAITRRTNIFNANRIQPSNGNQAYERHLPSIRDAAGPVERQQVQYQQSYDDLQSRSRAKTPVTTASPKSTARPPSASFSSLYNTLAKRSNENFISSTGDFDELNKLGSHQSRRASNDSNKYGITTTNPTPTKAITVLPKHSGDSGVDIRYSASPPDVNQQVRSSNFPTRLRSNIQTETVPIHEPITTTKERTHNGKTIT